MQFFWPRLIPFYIQKKGPHAHLERCISFNIQLSLLKFCTKLVETLFLMTIYLPKFENIFSAPNLHSKKKCDYFWTWVYIRYVDDIFAVFSSHTDFSKFLNILNRQHPNIRFTYEGNCDTLPFLDTEIKIDGPTFKSEVYRKKNKHQYYVEL